jgi:hypothetical protein
MLTFCLHGRQDFHEDGPDMFMVIIKAGGLWVPLVPLAIVNGAIREGVLAPMLGQRLALPLSGVSLSVLIFLFALMVAPWLGASAKAPYVAAGMVWLLLTVLFEFLFGYYVMGKSWVQLLAAYNVVDGNLWVLVLISTPLSPFLGAKVRGRV